MGASKEGLVLAGCVSWMGAIGSVESAGLFVSQAGFLGFYFIFIYVFGVVGLFFLHGVSFDSIPREESLGFELWVGLTLAWI